MDAISAQQLSQVKHETRLTYWSSVIQHAIGNSIRRGLGLALGILITALIAIYQNVHHVTIKDDGWWIFVRPYAVELAAWIAFQISESCWTLHRETTKRIAIARLESLLRQGDMMHGEFVNLGTDKDAAKEYWTIQVSRWREITNSVIAVNWTEEEKQRFNSMRNLPTGVQAGPTQQREMLKCNCANLEKLIADLRK